MHPLNATKSLEIILYGINCNHPIYKAVQSYSLDFELKNSQDSSIKLLHRSFTVGT